MPSKEALERRKRFVEAKKAAGSYESLRKEQRAKPVFVYFDPTGNIKGISRQEIPDFDYKFTKFTPDQTEILNGQNTDNFRIVEDPKVDNLYHIEPKPIESLVVLSENYAMMPVVKKKGTYEIAVEIKDNLFRVTMHTKARSQYIGIPSTDAAAKGQKTLRFYLTSKGDPHFLLNTVEVPLADLIDNKVVEVQLAKDDYENCDIYTIKLFEDYTRK